MMPTQPFERGRLPLIWKARGKQWRGKSLLCTGVLVLVLVLACTPCCVAVRGRALDYRGGGDHVYSPRAQCPPEDRSEDAPVSKKRGGIRFSFSLFGRRKDRDQREDKTKAQPCLERQEQPHHHYTAPKQDRYPHHHQHQHAYPPHDREREREMEAPMHGREHERVERRGYGRSERGGEEWEDRNGYGDRWQHHSHPRHAAPPNYHYNGRMVNVASAQASMQVRPKDKDGERREDRDADEGDWTFARFRAQIRKEVEEESRRLEELEEKRHRRAGAVEEPVVKPKPKEPVGREREEGEEEGAGLAVAPRTPRAKPRMRHHQQEAAAALDMTPEERKEATQALIHMRVHHQLHNQAMLYVSCTVNDKKVRACVDTGASTTVMSLKMARECGLMPHVDTSVVGGVKGVGFAKILGCVHDARIRLGRMEVRTRVSIIDCLSPPFVIGLDVLRHCKCDVSFRSNVLVLRNNEQEEVLPFFHATEDDEPPGPHHDHPPSLPHRPPRHSQRHAHLDSSPPLPRPASSARLSSSSSSLSSPLPPPPSSRSPPANNTRHAPPPPADEDTEEDNDEGGGGGVSMAGV